MKSHWDHDSEEQEDLNEIFSAESLSIMRNLLSESALESQFSPSPPATPPISTPPPPSQSSRKRGRRATIDDTTLLDLLKPALELTLADLQRRTGASLSTISRRVRRLHQEGKVCIRRAPHRRTLLIRLNREE
ncbi:MAG: winged helix-turn-helix transcriptional regulator [Candidatus Helarchaeota archaeon]